MPRSRAIRRPARVASPAVAPSLAPGRWSGNPARIRAVSRKEHGDAPRVGRHGSARTQVVDEILGRRRRLVVEELPVHHDHRCVVARRVALDVLEGDLSVRGRLTGVDVEVVFEDLEDRVTAHHRAQRIGAHAHQVLAGWRPPVHRVERGDRGHLGGCELELRCAEVDSGRGEVAVLGLHQVQQGQQRRPGVGIAGDDLSGIAGQPLGHLDRIGLRPSGYRWPGLVGPRAEVEVYRRHLSTPPITGSIDATAAIASATIPPSHIAATACRLVNDGSR